VNQSPEQSEGDKAILKRRDCFTSFAMTEKMVSFRGSETTEAI